MNLPIQMVQLHFVNAMMLPHYHALVIAKQGFGKFGG